MSTATASIDEQNKLSIIKQHFDDMAKLIAEVNKIYSSAVQSISKDNESLKKLQDVMHQLENFQKQKDAMFHYLDNVRETLSHQDLYQIISKQQTNINTIISKIQELQYDDNLEEVTSKIETYSNQIAELGKANESDVKNFDTLVEEDIRNIQKQFRDFREACIRITAKKLAVQQKTQEQTNELEQRIQMMQDVLLNQKNSSQSARTVNSNLTRMINKIAEEASYFNKKRNTVNSRSLLTLIQRLKKYHDSTKRKPHTIANFSQEVSALTDITSSLLEEEYHSLMADMKNGTEVTAEQIQHFNDIFTKTLDKQGKLLTGKSFDIFVKYMPKLKGEHKRILTSFETLYSYPKLVTNAYIDTLVNELKQLGIWNHKTLNILKQFDGSIQNLNINEPYKYPLADIFAGVFELDSADLIECAALRQKWIDQAQSLNIYLDKPSGKKLNDLYQQAWKSGLKSTYYLRTLGASQTEKNIICRIW